MFQERHHLTAHSRIHSGEQPFNCRYCERGFTDRSNCTRHEQGHEAKDKKKARRKREDGVEVEGEVAEGIEEAVDGDAELLSKKPRRGRQPKKAAHTVQLLPPNNTITSTNTLLSNILPSTAVSSAPSGIPLTKVLISALAPRSNNSSKLAIQDLIKTSNPLFSAVRGLTTRFSMNNTNNQVIVENQDKSQLAIPPLPLEINETTVAVKEDKTEEKPNDEIPKLES